MIPGDVTPDDSNDALLAGHALGDLDEAEREQLAILLREQPQLGQRLNEFRTTLELLPLALPQTAPPPQRLRQRLIGRQGSPVLARPGRGPIPGGWLWPAVVGVALLGLGYELHQTRQQLAQLQGHLQASAPAVEASRRMVLEAVDPSVPATGEVMVTGNPTHNVLMLNGLPPPPPHHVYRLWANVDGLKVGCVAFVPTAQGHVAMLIPTMPTSVATSVSVTLENDQVGASPSGRMVLSSSI
ncbi:anti-sigma factor domain-containing protein [Synechococcus sp. CS-1332]|uniref:anti-sigma factor domain-containing protein n=1 Tax=Synechococcus sp. CS-1332 TaxID=2847972 RepID=UPI0021E3D129|nr:anti-sigma factor [Synechococcus sp. CS-1332]MCT0206401.1 anti-sigma factor [Synechococcus sp. CS-1332]